MIKQAFFQQTAHYGAPPELAEQLWQEVELCYTGEDRHFHDLDHLNYLLGELLPLKSQIKNWDAVFFALVYHDVIYDVAQHTIASDDEIRSAAFAEVQLKQLGLPAEKIESCKRIILATEKHQAVRDTDTNLFTDADLSILGQPWGTYTVYMNNIQKEFSVFPEHIYNAGRRKVLQHFLQMEPLFKTLHFQKLYEKKAKENMRKEHDMLLT